jgi:hypothetical protein
MLCATEELRGKDIRWSKLLHNGECEEGRGGERRERRERGRGWKWDTLRLFRIKNENFG